MAAPSLQLQNVYANGTDGNPSVSQDEGSGGDAGGSIFLSGDDVQINSNVTALGGAGFQPVDAQGGKGGNGSLGRICINAPHITGFSTIPAYQQY